jgi:hypothetical protein
MNEFNCNLDELLYLSMNQEIQMNIALTLIVYLINI